MIKTLFNKILDILFPRNKAEKQLDIISAEELYSKAPKTTHPDKNIMIVFDYNDKLIRQAIWSLKFRKNKRLAKIFGQILYDEILENLFEMKTFSNFKEPILIPIPLSKQRFRERGFNQSELIAKEIYDLNREVFNFENKALIKIKNTSPQSRSKNKKERLENLKGCFTVSNAHKIRNRNIILIDDVTTTGATLAEAKRVLKKYGAKKIISLVVAH